MRELKEHREELKVESLYPERRNLGTSPGAVLCSVSGALMEIHLRAVFHAWNRCE